MWKGLKNYWKLYELKNRKKKSWEFYSVIRVWWLHLLSLETNIFPICLEIYREDSVIENSYSRILIFPDFPYWKKKSGSKTKIQLKRKGKFFPNINSKSGKFSFRKNFWIYSNSKTFSTKKKYQKIRFQKTLPFPINDFIKIPKEKKSHQKITEKFPRKWFIKVKKNPENNLKKKKKLWKISNKYFIKVKTF